LAEIIQALAKVRVAAETGDAAVPPRRSERRWRVVDRIGEQATRELLRVAGSSSTVTDNAARSVSRASLIVRSDAASVRRT
jgi:hypothetical protein